MPYCAGSDRGAGEHGVCVIDRADGRIVLQDPIPHMAEGLGDLTRRPAKPAPPAELPIAIERPSGLLVDTLLAAGHPVVFRRACNHRLRQAVTCFADNSRHSSAWAADIYRRARQRGCDHPHAVRILARAWVRVL